MGDDTVVGVHQSPHSRPSMSLRQEIEAWVAALVHLDVQDYEAALIAFSDLASTAKMIFNCGVLCATLGNHEDAIGHYQRAVQLDRYLAVAYFQQGVSNFLLGDYEEALANFNDTLLHLRGNSCVDYGQLGLDFKLHSCEVLFNRGLCSIYTRQHDAGMQDLFYASKEKAVPEHDVIVEAMRDRALGYTVFSIPVGVVYRPNPAKVKNMRSKDYLGNAQLVAQQLIATQQRSLHIRDLPARGKDEGGSFGAMNLVRPDLTSRMYHVNTEFTEAQVGLLESSPALSRPGSVQRPGHGTSKTSHFTNQSISSLVPTTYTLDVREPQQVPVLDINTARHFNADEPGDGDPTRDYKTGPSRRQLSLRTSPRTLQSQQSFLHYRQRSSDSHGPGAFLYDRQRSLDPHGPCAESSTNSDYSHPFRSSPTTSSLDHHSDEYVSPATTTSSPDRPPDTHENPSARAPSSLRTASCTPVNPTSDAYKSPPRTLAQRRVDSRSRPHPHQRPSRISQTAPAVRNVRIKLHAEYDIRYLQVSDTARFEDIKDLIVAKLGLDKAGLGTGCRIKVRDDEGDMITLGDGEDWTVALEAACKVATLEYDQGGGPELTVRMDVWASTA